MDCYYHCGIKSNSISYYGPQHISRLFQQNAEAESIDRRKCCVSWHKTIFIVSKQKEKNGEISIMECLKDLTLPTFLEFSYRVVELYKNYRAYFRGSVHSR